MNIMGMVVQFVFSYVEYVRTCATSVSTNSYTVCLIMRGTCASVGIAVSAFTVNELRNIFSEIVFQSVVDQ